MKKLVYLFLLLGISSYSKMNVATKNMVKNINELTTLKKTNKPYTGMVINGRDREYFVKGKPEGRWITFYKNGKLKSIENWKDGNLNGKYILYRKSGVKYVETYYEKGVENGKYKAFYENGKLRVLGHLKKGEAHGEWKFYKNTEKI